MDDETNRLLAKRLRAALDELGITIKATAPQVGMSPQSLYRKLRGERPITWNELVNLSVLVNRHPGSFLRDRDA